MLPLRQNRLEKKQSRYLTHEGISLWLETGTIEAGGKQAELTKNELRIMYYLFEHDGVICTRADLIEYLWDNRLYSDTSYHNEELKSLTRYRFDKVKERDYEEKSVNMIYYDKNGRQA